VRWLTLRSIKFLMWRTSVYVYKREPVFNLPFPTDSSLSNHTWNFGKQTAITTMHCYTSLVTLLVVIRAVRTINPVTPSMTLKARTDAPGGLVFDCSRIPGIAENMDGEIT